MRMALLAIAMSPLLLLTTPAIAEPSAAELLKSPAGGEPAGLKLAWRGTGGCVLPSHAFNPATRYLVPLPYAAWTSSANFLRA